jgi:SAM-dependent methyltransferase
MAETYSKGGDINLEILDRADKFTEWTYRQIAPFLGGTILEIGSGRGTYSKKIVRDFPKNKIVLSDIDPDYAEGLKKQFKEDNVSAIKLDLESKEDFESLPCRFDSAVALNVLEHVEDDVASLKYVFDSLNPGGRFVVLVPAHMFLYNRIDKSLGHHRRYTKKEFIRKVSQTEFIVEEFFYFNFLSIFGWYWNGNILKKEVLNEQAMGFLNMLVPYLDYLEKNILRKKIGISLIFVLRK